MRTIFFLLLAASFVNAAPLTTEQRQREIKAIRELAKQQSTLVTELEAELHMARMDLVSSQNDAAEAKTQLDAVHQSLTEAQSRAEQLQADVNKQAEDLFAAQEEARKSEAEKQKIQRRYHFLKLGASIFAALVSVFVVRYLKLPGYAAIGTPILTFGILWFSL